MFQNQESVAKVKTVVKNETDSSFQAMKWCSSTDSEAGTRYIFNQTIKVEVNCPEMEFSTFPLDTQHCGFYLGDITKTSLMTGDLAVTWLPAQLDTAFLNHLSNSEFTISTTTEGILKEIIWIWLSITFVVSALIEYFTILTILKFSKKKVTIKLPLFADLSFLPL